jgi:hypothetical protein
MVADVPWTLVPQCSGPIPSRAPLSAVNGGRPAYAPVHLRPVQGHRPRAMERDVCSTRWRRSFLRAPATEDDECTAGNPANRSEERETRPMCRAKDSRDYRR